MIKNIDLNKNKLSYQRIIFSISIAILFITITNNSLVLFLIMLFAISAFIIIEFFNLMNKIKIKNKKLLLISFTSYVLFFFYTIYDISIIQKEYKPDLILLLFITIWLNDSGGYLIGKLLGRKKIFNKISPNKTLEGYIGSLILMIIGLEVISHDQKNFISNFNIVVISIIWMFGNAGDLLFSYIKRLANVKDSGKVMWLHGGMIDRFDSSLLSIPVIFLYLFFNKLL
ncbi:MAG: hypothetical protein CMP58_03065 [Flavobacteriales bacterium]|nr:hypothetical protein [Flavobacteriales bacterium]